MNEAPTQDDVRIERSSVDQVGQVAEALFPLHVRELEPSMAEHLDPNWEAYLDAEDEDRLIVLVAWLGDECVGYAVASLFQHPHYQKLMVCQQDLLFVVENSRGGQVGARLIKKLRDEARKRGAHHLLMHAKPGSRLMALLPRLGFEPEEATFKEIL